MKKLMFTAAAAAMTAGAFAGAVQVYDMTVNVKTLACKDNGKIVDDKSGSQHYRAQTSVKLEGKFWGCGCYTIASPIADQYGRPDLNVADADDICCDGNSYMFWTPKAAFHQVNFNWILLQLCGKKSENVAGVFNADFYLCDGSTAEEKPCFSLVGAGYGTANGLASPLNCIKSMSGSVVGMSDVDQLDVAIGCAYCGDTGDCGAYEFCPTGADASRADWAPAWGTFTLKYNSSLSNKIANGKKINAAYKFKDFVTAEFDCIAAGDEPEQADPVRNYQLAKQAVATAEENLAAANAEVSRLETRDTLVKLSAMPQEGTAEGVAIYDADTNAYKQATAATIKAIAATEKAELAFRASYGYIGGLTADADELIADAKVVIDKNDAYNKAKAKYDEVMANSGSAAPLKASAKTRLLEAEMAQKAAVTAYETIMKSDKATIMTATVKTDFANYEKAYKAKIDAATAEMTAATLPNTTKWLSNWGVADEKVVEGTQWAAYKAAKAVQTEANNAKAAADEALVRAQNECIASGTVCF